MYEHYLKFEAIHDDTRNTDDLKYIPHLLTCNNGSTTKKLVENAIDFELTVTSFVNQKFIYGKVMGISGANKYVLVFRVEYKIETGEIMEETLVSKPFQVVANANSMHKMKPNQGNNMFNIFS